MHQRVLLFFRETQQPLSTTLCNNVLESNGKGKGISTPNRASVVVLATVERTIGGCWPEPLLLPVGCALRLVQLIAVNAQVEVENPSYEPELPSLVICGLPDSVCYLALSIPAACVSPYGLQGRTNVLLANYI